MRIFTLLAIWLVVCGSAWGGDSIAMSEHDERHSYAPISFYAVSAGNRELVGCRVAVSGVVVLSREERNVSNLFANRDDWTNLRFANSVKLVVPDRLFAEMEKRATNLFGKEATVFGVVKIIKVRGIEKLCIEVQIFEPLPH